jgi:hypothetical protein
MNLNRSTAQFDMAFYEENKANHERAPGVNTTQPLMRKVLQP